MLELNHYLCSIIFLLNGFYFDGKAKDNDWVDRLNGSDIPYTFSLRVCVHANVNVKVSEMEHIIEHNRKAFIDIPRFFLCAVLSFFCTMPKCAATNSKNQIKSYQFICKASITAQLNLKSYLLKFWNEQAND